MAILSNAFDRDTSGVKTKYVAIRPFMYQGKVVNKGDTVEFTKDEYAWLNVKVKPYRAPKIVKKTTKPRTRRTTSVKKSEVETI